MATHKQKKLVRKIIENYSNPADKKTAKDLLIESGYKPNTAIQSTTILKGKGVLQLFKEAGISQEKIASKYNDLLNMDLKEDKISADTLRKTLDDISKRIIDPQEERQKKSISFINQFIKMPSESEARKEPIEIIDDNSTLRIE